MNVITKIWVLLLWAQTLTFVKCQECTRDQFLKGPIYDSHFDTSGMAETYPGGKQVRVPCVVGYTGFFKLICTEGNWKPVGAKCEAKSCGHPGDAQFADFELENGEDFIFGSQVVYKCQKGYHMVSRGNRRRCKADGWDGVIPVCEPINCPSFRVDPNVQIIGDPEGANFGNVVRFICKSSSEILKGSPEVYCDENGQWVGQVPKCEEVKCDVPVIEHGTVSGGRQQYKENEVLNFNCDLSYKRTDDRQSRCMKVGTSAEWIPTPGCKLIQCELTPLPGTTYRPQNKNLFLPRENLQVTCGERDYILDHQKKKKPTADVTCKDDGEWNINPGCLEVTCPNYLPNENLYRYVYARENKLGNTVWYDCGRNYKKPHGVTHATCTRDGWTPKPLCQSSFCEEPDIENAEIIRGARRSYRHGDEVTYRCLNRVQDSFTATCEQGTWTGNSGCSGVRPCTKPEIANGFSVGPFNNTVYYSCNENYKLFAKGWWGEAKCVDGVWSGLQTCTENSMCGEAPEFPNGKLRRQKRPGERENLQIVCNEGYRRNNEQIPCHDGVWDLEALKTICSPIAELCSPPPKVKNTVIKTPYKKSYLSGSSVTYKCRERYEMEGDDTITCNNGNWEDKNITCIPYCEKLRDVKLTVKSTVDKNRYNDGEVIEYVCKAPDKIPEGNATCVNSKWNKTVECPAIPCEVGNLTTGLGIKGFRPKNNKAKAGQKLKFFCLDNYDKEGFDETECLETGKWKDPFPTCSEKCSIPEIPDDLRIIQSGFFYLSKGESITFECRERGYFPDGNEKMECLGNGQWIGVPPTCEKKCQVPTVTENVLISPLAQGQMRVGQTLTFACNAGLSLKGNSIIKCLEDGEWNGPPPTCGGSVCGNPPLLENGDTVGINKPEYQLNEKVQYMCQNTYTMQGGPHKTCTRGVWTGEIKCLRPCTVDREEMNRRNIQFAYVSKDKLYAPHNDHLTFACKHRTTQVSSESMQRKCIDGEMNLPACQ